MAGLSSISEFRIPESFRGLDIVFGLQGYHSLGTGWIQCDYQTSLSYIYTFSEEVE